ncbi:MAG: hypothetical protein AAGB05_11670 [Pseudomonadota bacterium]
MSRKPAILPEPSHPTPGLVYDLQAMSHNAEIVRSIASACGFRTRVVLKGGFAIPKILDHLGSADHFPISIGNSVGEPAVGCKVHDLATLYPGQAPASAAWRTVRRVTEVTLAGVAAALKAFGRPELLVAVRTSENREGLRAQEIPEFLSAVEHTFAGRVSVAGFQLNYGCAVEAPPPPGELRQIMVALSREDVVRRMKSRPLLSLGGSVLLPILHSVPVPEGFRAELRLGEAIVVGTIPGQSSSLGLARTAVLNAPVRHVRPAERGGEQSMMIDAGSLILSQTRTALARDGIRFASMGSEVSHVCRHADGSADAPDVLRFPLEYSETERALHRFGATAAPQRIQWLEPR